MEKKELEGILKDFLAIIDSELPDNIDISSELEIDGINLCKFLKAAVDRIKEEWIYVPF